MDEQMEASEGRLGIVSIDPHVLVTIARLSALGVSGVCRTSPRVPYRLRGVGTTGDGTRVLVEDDTVTVDLHIIADSSAAMLDVGRAVQAEVKRAIQEMVGMPVVAVNVRIEDVEFPCSSAWPSED